METPLLAFESVGLKLEPPEEYYSENDEDISSKEYSGNDVKPDISKLPLYGGQEEDIPKIKAIKANKKNHKDVSISNDPKKLLVLEAKDLPYTIDNTDKKLFRCKLCGDPFPRLSSLMFHNGVKHCNKLPKGDHVSFRCNICGQCFPKHGMYIKHFMSHADPASLKPIECNSCDMRFEYLYLLKRHVLSSHSNVTPFKCDVCGKHFGQKSHLERHTKRHEKPGLDCTHCNEQFPNIFALKSHQKEFGLEKPFKCHLCYRTYNFEFHLQIHLKTHEKSSLVYCKVCGRCFSRKAELTKHTSINNCKSGQADGNLDWIGNPVKPDHGDMDSLICDTVLEESCELSASTENNNYPSSVNNEIINKPSGESINSNEEIPNDLDELPAYNGADFLEVQIEEDPEVFDMSLTSIKSTSTIIDRINNENTLNLADQIFKCHLCPMTFNYIARLKAHIHVHKTETDHYCKICNVFFSQKLYLEQHVKFHDARKRVSCQMCPKSFQLGVKFQDHTDSHCDLKSYSCKHCNKMFAYQRSLNVHVKKHSDVKPYSCEVCKKIFVRKSGLLLHSYVHSNVRTHQCDYCKKYFTVKNQVMRHILRVHSRVRPHPCSECPMTFSEKNLLNRHLTTVHTIKANKCTACGRIYKNYRTLVQHRRRSIKCGKEMVVTGPR